MSGMLLHCGSQQVDFNKVVAVKPPQATQTYMPVRHNDFYDMVLDTFNDRGLKLTNIAHALDRSGSKYFGIAEVRSRSTDDFCLSVGWRNSYNKSLAASIVVGSKVFVCDNLAFYGEIVVGRKHTPHILQDLPTLIDQAVDKAEVIHTRQVETAESYKEVPLLDSEIDELCSALLRSNAVPAVESVNLLTECYKPSHQEHLTGGFRTLWTVLNAATEVLKGRSIQTLPKRSARVYTILDAYKENRREGLQQLPFLKAA